MAFAVIQKCHSFSYVVCLIHSTRLVNILVSQLSLFHIHTHTQRHEPGHTSETINKIVCHVNMDDICKTEDGNIAIMLTYTD